MKVKLKWVNRNQQPVMVSIYRRTEIVPAESLTDPIAVLPGEVTEFIDEDLVRGQRYYYWFKTTGVTDTLMSPPKEVMAVTYTGPGPQVLQHGDLSYGYYGEVAAGAFFGADELIAAVGLTDSPVLNAWPVWDKWVRNGKVCFVPRMLLAQNASWKKLYDLGLVYGVDGPGPYYPDTPVDQGRTVTKAGNTYRVRLLRNADDRNNPERRLPDGGDINNPSYRMYSEVADFYYPLLLHVTPPEQRIVNVASLAQTAIVTANYWSFTQELDSDNQNALVLGTAAETRAAFTRVMLNPYNSTHTTRCWRPVLELMEYTEVDV